MLTSVTNSIRRVPTSTLAAIAFFAVALFISTFFVGDIGVYNDDHFCNQRDPVTHEPHDFVMNRPWHLWRPLTRVVLIPLVTALWPWPWALHAISAVLHGVVVWLLYALLRRFGIRATLAAPVALAFMLYPVHFEAVLWIDIICTLMSVVVVLGIWNTYLWWIAASHERSGNLRFVLLVLLGAAAWCAAAMNEQPPGALAALPLAVLVSGLAVAPTLRGRLSRSAMPIAAVGIGLLIYLQGYFKHTGRASQADVETAVVESLPQNLADLASKIPRELYLKNVAMGALTQGAGVVAAHPFRAARVLRVPVDDEASAQPGYGCRVAADVRAALVDPARTRMVCSVVAPGCGGAFHDLAAAALRSLDGAGAHRGGGSVNGRDRAGARLV